MATRPDFGFAIRVLRAARNLSQDEMARRAGISASYACLLEQGRRSAPAPKILTALCAALGVQWSEFLAVADRRPSAAEAVCAALFRTNRAPR